MNDLRPIRGTKDFLPEESRLRRHIEETACALADCYGFGEIATPVMEFTDVFARSLGDSSDIVTKEMYTFADRSGQSITLRPENTAGVVRAFLSNGLTQQIPAKFFYRGPMFRYERPQKGRLRQFHQIGVENIGQRDAAADVEAIALAGDFLDAIGVLPKTVLELNTLGDSADRAAYRDDLVRYLEAYRGDLSEDSRTRLDRNPLRILDSKDETDRQIIAGAPSLLDKLGVESRQFFASLCRYLDRLGLVYRVNPRLVRGLDYYCHTVFEFVSDALGAQSAVLAGGRYDNLVAMMGGNDIPGTGWAAGVERLMLLAEAPPGRPRPIAVIPQSEREIGDALDVARRLRRRRIPVEVIGGGGLGKKLKRANKLNAARAILIGEEETRDGVLLVRDMDSGEQERLAASALESRFSTGP